MNIDQPYATFSSPASGIQFKYFSFLLTFFAATWLIANIAAVKMVSIFGITFTGGFIIFPITTMLNSVITETYGYKGSRQAIWAGFILNILYVILINIIYFVPSAPHWKMSEQFKSILIPETRIIMASVVSFIFSDFINSFLIVKMKLRTKGASLYKRIILASIVALSVDITLFIIIAFYQVLPDALLLKLLIVAYCKKIICQILMLPLAFYLITLLKKYEGIDIYDYETKFNPFILDNVYNLKNNQLYKA